MAFNSIVEDSRRMNAKMIAMGQSIDIQKMPRPKAGTQMAKKQIMFTPTGSEVEKMLYPKNFKPRTYEETENTSAPEPMTQKEEAKTMQAVEEIIEAQKQETEENTPEPKVAIIGDDEIEENNPEETQITESKAEVIAKPFPKNSWESCKHYKAQGDRAFCKEYLGWCAKNKCARPKY